MQVLVFLVYAFVNTFGITQPTPAGARRAARGLGIFLLLAAMVLAGLGFGLHGVLSGR